MFLNKIIQVSLAICGGYVLSNSENREHQYKYYWPKLVYFTSKIAVFPRYSRFFSPRIAKPRIARAACIFFLFHILYLKKTVLKLVKTFLMATMLPILFLPVHHYHSLPLSLSLSHSLSLSR